MKMGILKFLISTILLINSVTSASYNCKTNQTIFKKGDNTTICVFLKNKDRRLAFPVVVDKYSVLQLSGLYMYLSDTTPNQTLTPLSESLTIGFYNVTTKISSLYLDPTQKSMYTPVLNVIVIMDKGNVTDVVFQNECYTCKNTPTCNTKSYVVNNLTYNDNNCLETLPANCSNSYQCDPKIYLTWFGTDSKGDYFDSSNLSMEKFKQYSINSLFNSAQQIFNNSISSAITSFQEVKNWLTNTTKS